MSLLDRVGQRFGRMFALERSGSDKQGRATWLCLCDCGGTKIVASRHLGSGATSSCGCRQRESSALNGRGRTGMDTGTDSPHYKEVVGYSAVHHRVYTAKGPASRYACADCGVQAHHWAYDVMDINHLVSPEGLVYSLDPDHYFPLCVTCHSAHDWVTRTKVLA